jgi:hypothetical protein
LPNLTCETCGTSFFQGRGRPARRCPPCRGDDRYGSAHRSYRAATIASAIGKPCARCRRTILPGEAVDLDHADDRPGYLGYSHRRCNSSAGASRGNAMRAAAYRAYKAGVLPAELNGSAEVTSPALELRYDPEHRCDLSDCHAGGVGSPCRCGRHSRVW